MMNKRENVMVEIKLIDGKYHGIVNGNTVVKSSSKYYCERVLKDHKQDVQEEVTQPVSEFDINERFDFINSVVKMVATGQTPSVIITGDGGLGKSHTVIQSLVEAGMKDMTAVLSEAEVGSVVQSKNCFAVIKGFSTAKALFRTLYENRNSIIVFDDCDSILKDPDALNLLKGALDSYDRRYVTWNSEMRDSDLPRMFEFKGGVIFVSNLKQDKINQALKTRSMNIDVSMTLDQKLQRMDKIMHNSGFMDFVNVEVKEKSLAMIKEYGHNCKEVSLRTLIQTIKIMSSDCSNKEQLAKYMLVA